MTQHTTRDIELTLWKDDDYPRKCSFTMHFHSERHDRIDTYHFVVRVSPFNKDNKSAFISFSSWKVNHFNSLFVNIDVNDMQKVLYNEETFFNIPFIEGLNERKFGFVVTTGMDSDRYFKVQIEAIRYSDKDAVFEHFYLQHGKTIQLNQDYTDAALKTAPPTATNSGFKRARPSM